MSDQPPSPESDKTVHADYSKFPELGDVLVSEEVLQQTVAALGARIAVDYADRRPLLVCVLKGAFVFMADLARAIPISVEVDFMAVSSYGASTTSSGVVKIVKDLDADISGRHVILVEDIVDSGLTMNYVRELLLARGPASLEICALLVRETVPHVDLSSLRYLGLTIPDDWVVGYGLDTDQRWRNLRDIRRWNVVG
jgi:hypoxanthine phosphoribosyltransferase